MKRIALVALACGLSACAPFRPSLGPRYYLSASPHTFTDSTADTVTVHLDEKLVVELNSLLFLGRREHLEQAACLRVERIDRRGVWIDSVLQAAIDVGRTTEDGISFTCNSDAVPYHAHVVFARDGWDQCLASPKDRASILSVFPAELMQCGFGIDSLFAYRVRRR